MSVLRRVFQLFFTALWTLFVLMRMCFDAITTGPRNFFSWKKRTTAPEVLTKGWNHEFIKLSSVKLHYVHCGDRSKPLMLFLHGFPEFWYTWRHQLKEFSTDYWCVAIDQRGYGDSDKPKHYMDYSMKWLVQDVNEVIQALGYQSCVLVSHDWGGAVAWRVALACPERVDKLIVMNCPHPSAFAKHLSSNMAQFLKSWYMFFFQAPFVPELMMKVKDYAMLKNMFTKPPMGTRNKFAFTEEDIEAWKYTYSQPGALTPPIDYYRAAFASSGALTASGAKDKCLVQPPTLLIWGTNDQALALPMAELSTTYCRSCSVRYVQGASHWVQNDEPKMCNQFMKDFLAGELKTPMR